MKVACINDATGNPLAQDRIQKTVSLQEKLEFPDNVSSPEAYGDEDHRLTMSSSVSSRTCTANWAR